MKKSFARPLIVAAAMIATPTLAFAHTGTGHIHGFAQGFAHPFSGADHMLAVLAVGLFALAQGGRSLWLVPLSFITMMVAGFLLGLNQVNVPYVELGIALSAVVIGLAAAFARPVSPLLAMALVGFFAIFHGHAHGAEMLAGNTAVTYAAGFIIATVLLHATGIASAGTAMRLASNRWVRFGGGLCAAGGMGVLAGWL